MNYDVIPEKLSESFSVSTHVGCQSILPQKVYRECPLFVNQKSNMDYLIELDMVDFDIIFCMDWLHSCYTPIDCKT